MVPLYQKHPILESKLPPFCPWMESSGTILAALLLTPWAEMSMSNRTSGALVLWSTSSAPKLSLSHSKSVSPMNYLGGHMER